MNQWVTAGGHDFCFARCVLFTQHSVTLELPVEVSFITPPLSMVAWAPDAGPRKMIVIKTEVNVF